MRILVVYPDQATGEGIVSGLSAAPEVEHAESVRTVEGAVELLARPTVRFDVVVVSAGRSDDDALALATRFREGEDRPDVVVTGLPNVDGAILRHVEAGADAYLTEEISIEGLLMVLRLLDRGEVLVAPSTARALISRLHAMAALLDRSGIDVSAVASLTPRESEILALLGERLTNKEIAERLFIGVGTVKSHVHAILKKLDVRDREEARRVLIVARATDDGQPTTGTFTRAGPSSDGGA